MFFAYLLLLVFGLWCPSSPSPFYAFSTVLTMASPNLPPDSDPPPLKQNSTPQPPLPALSPHGFSSFSDALRRGVVSHGPGDDVPPPRPVEDLPNPDLT